MRDRDAGITPQTAQVRPDEADLTRITGAQAPSGVPCVITAPVVERARRTARELVDNGTPIEAACRIVILEDQLEEPSASTPNTAVPPNQ